MRSEIDRLLRERQATILRERRGTERHHFVRPVMIAPQRNGNEPVQGFSKDMSPHGMAIISCCNWQVGLLATLRVHSLFEKDVSVRAEARWSESYGDGWFITGWHFLDVD